MVSQNRNFVSQMDSASDTFQKAVEAGMKMHEQAVRFWGGSCMTGMYADARQRMERMADEWMPLMQKNVEQYTRAVEEQFQTGMNLMSQAFDSGRGMANTGMPRRAFELWSSTADAMRSQAETINRMNAQAVESFSQLVHGAFGGAANEETTNGAGRKPAAEPRTRASSGE